MLIHDGDTYLWTGSLADLKCFVDEILNLKGKWSSPGGEAKRSCFVLQSLTLLLNGLAGGPRNL
jgi:hypothetical protein